MKMCSKEKPYKTLTHAFYRSAGNPGIIYVRESQIFSDLESETIKVSQNLTIKYICPIGPSQ